MTVHQKMRAGVPFTQLPNELPQALYLLWLWRHLLRLFINDVVEPQLQPLMWRECRVVVRHRGARVQQGEHVAHTGTLIARQLAEAANSDLERQSHHRLAGRRSAVAAAVKRQSSDRARQLQ